jgi:hypothetical protein
MTMSSLNIARMVPELVLLACGDVLIHGGESGEYGNAGFKSVCVDERWIAATGLCQVVEDALKKPPEDAVCWNPETRSMVTLTEWPGKHSYGRIALPRGGEVSAGGEHSVDTGRFGFRPEMDTTLVVDASGSKLKLSAARAKPAMTLLRDGRVVVSGGYTVGIDYSWENVYNGAAAIDIVDTGRVRVSRGPMLKVARYRHGVIEIAPGRLLVVGGTMKDDSPIKDIEIVDVR